MRVLALDPGATRMGWAVLYGGTYIASGTYGVERKSLTYHDYRLKVIRDFTGWFENQLSWFDPEVVVSETLPVRGFSNMSQALLAQAAITSCQSVASLPGHPYKVDQIAAQTVKKRIGGKPKATKVGVRNGVLQLLPELAPKKSQWTKVFDESDAIAIGLAYLGYVNSNP